MVCIIKYGVESFDRLHGQVVRASELQPEGQGLDFRSGHTKDFKMEPIAVVLGAQHKQWSREKASESQLEKTPWQPRLKPTGYKLSRKTSSN